MSTDIFTQDFNRFCVYFSNEKAIQKIICIDCDHGISKCPSISELSPMIIGPGMLPSLCNRPILFVSSRGTPCRKIKFQKSTLFISLNIKYLYISPRAKFSFTSTGGEIASNVCKVGQLASGLVSTCIIESKTGNPPQEYH